MKTVVEFKLLPYADMPVAFFPCIRSRSVSYNETLCYDHLVEHTIASISFYNKCRPATLEQYEPLKAELEQLFGYDLAVLNEIL